MNNEQQTINVDNKDYNIDDLSQECLEYLQHVQNLQTKLSEAEFNSKQLRVALTAFLTMFKNSLPKESNNQQLELELE
jgi:hypothetical protein